MAIQTIYRGVEGDSSKQFTAGSAFDTAQANDEYLDSVKPTVIENFAAIASTPVVVGNVYNLKEYNSGTGLGGGSLEAYASTDTPDDGTIFAPATSGVRLKRLGATPAYVNVEWFGINGSDGGIPPDETTAIQALFDSTAIKGIVFGPRRYGATYLTHTVEKNFIIGTGFTLIVGLASSPTRCLFDLRTGNGLHMFGIKFQGNQNTNYTCGMQWYTNDLNLFYPGKAKLDLEFGEFLLGVNIGMLASQTTYYAQGTSQAVGIATDAPLSECSIRFRIQDCPSGLRVCQPNGKLTLIDSYVSAEGLSWASPPAASTWTAFELERFGEISMIGGSLEAVHTGAGTFIKQNGGNFFVESVVLESLSPSKISSPNSTSYFSTRFSKLLNFGYNSTSEPMFYIKSDAVGEISVDNSWLTFPYENMTVGTAILAKGVSDFSALAYAEAPNVLINLSQVELRDPAWPPATAWKMPCQGVKFKFDDVSLTSFADIAFANTPRLVNARLSNSTVNVLASSIDNSNATVTPSPVTTPTTTGGWTFTSGGGGYAYGRVTPAATLNIGSLNGVAQTPTYALRMQANAGVTLTAESPSFNMEPFSYVLVTGWVYIAAGGGALMKIKLNSRDFADADISTTDLATGAVNLLASGWQPFAVWGKQVATGSKARIQLYVESGVDAQFFGVSAYVDK